MTKSIGMFQQTRTKLRMDPWEYSFSFSLLEPTYNLNLDLDLSQTGSNDNPRRQLLGNACESQWNFLSTVIVEFMDMHIAVDG